MWKNIPNIENYQVNNLGNIRNIKTKKILNAWVQNTGYLTVTLNRNKYSIHRIIAQTFIPNPNNLPIINHKDGNKLNNKVENLEWCSYKHNINEAQRLGLYDNRNKKMSLYPLRSKNINQYDMQGNYIKTFRDSVIAEKELKKQKIKVNARNIRACCNGKRKTSGGYIWRYL